MLESDSFHWVSLLTSCNVCNICVCIDVYVHCVSLISIGSLWALCYWPTVLITPKESHPVIAWGNEPSRCRHAWQHHWVHSLAVRATELQPTTTFTECLTNHHMLNVGRMNVVFSGVPWNLPHHTLETISSGSWDKKVSARSRFIHVRSRIDSNVSSLLSINRISPIE